MSERFYNPHIKKHKATSPDELSDWSVDTPASFLSTLVAQLFKQYYIFRVFQTFESVIWGFLRVIYQGKTWMPRSGVVL